MGHTTRISDYEWDRGDGPKEIPEGVDIEKSVTKSKVVIPKKKPEETTTTASVKDAKSK